MPFVKSHGLDIHYVSTGQGNDILFIHGAGGNAAAWADQTSYFGPRHRITAYDHRAFGRSHCGVADVKPQQFADDALAVMDAVGIEKADVICQSLGGWTGLRLGLQAPERVRKLVLSCTMAGVAHAPAIESLIASTAKMDERGPASVALGHAFMENNPTKAYAYEQLGAFNTSFDPAMMAPVLAEDALVPLADLARVQCPVLFLNAVDDAIWPPHTVEGIKDAIPGARQVVVEGSGHSPYFEIPDVFNSIVEQFLAK